ncbi:MAG: fibronectin type III domain-containing protein [Candidatus Desantisbacteria bacterium]
MFFIRTIIAVFFLFAVFSHAESAAINKFTVLNDSPSETYTFNDNELIGFRMEIGISTSSELPATFSFTVRNPAGDTCLNIGDYKIESGQSYCGGQVLNIPISKFYIKQGTYTLIGRAIFNNGQDISTQTTFFVTDTLPPTAPSNIHDEGATTNDPTRLICSWSSAADPQSGIQEYRYCFGTSPGMDNIVSWRSNGLATSITHTGLSLTEGTTYYFTVKVVNGAGLLSSPVSSDGITYRAMASSLQITAVPSALSFSQNEATKSTTINLQVLGASGITLNRLIKKFTYTNGTIEESPAETISINIPAGAILQQIKEIIITPELRTRVLAGRTVGTFTITYQFSGYDAYSNPVQTLVNILVELRSTASEERIPFSISAISLTMPAPHPAAYNLHDVVYANLMITATGEGNVTGQVFIDGILMGEFSQRISGGTTLQIGSLTTSAAGKHTLRIEIIIPRFLSTEASYNVTKVEDPITKLSRLLLLDGIAELTDIDITAAPSSISGRYTLNGIGTISITPLKIILPVKLTDLQIALDSTDISRSTLLAGTVHTQDLTDKLFDLFEGLLPIKELNFGMVDSKWQLMLSGAVKLPESLGNTSVFNLDTAFKVSINGLIGTASTKGTSVCLLDPGIFKLQVKQLTVAASICDSKQEFALHADADFFIPSLPALSKVPLTNMLIKPDGSFSGSITLSSAPSFTLGELNVTLLTSISFDREGIIANGTGSVFVTGRKAEVGFDNFKLGMYSPLSVLSGTATIITGFDIPIGDVVKLGLPASVTLTSVGLLVSGTGSITVACFGESHTSDVNFREFSIIFNPSLEIQSGVAEILNSLKIPIAQVASLEIPLGVSLTKEGITISEVGGILDLKDVSSIPVSFEDFLIGLKPFGIRSGTAAISTRLDIPIGKVVKLNLPTTVSLTSAGLFVSGDGSITVSCFGKKRIAPVNFNKFVIGFGSFKIKDGTAEIQTRIKIPMGTITDLEIPSGLSFNNQGIIIPDGNGSLYIKDVAKATVKFEDLLIAFSPFGIQSGTANIQTSFDIPLGELARFTLSPGVSLNQAGIHVTGTATLQLKDNTSIGANFDDVSYCFADSSMQKGTITFDTGFALKVIGIGSKLSWECCRQNASMTITEIGADYGVLLNLPQQVQLTSAGLGISGTSNIQIKLGDNEVELEAQFKDGFNVAISPLVSVSTGSTVSVSTGSARFLFQGVEYGHLDKSGLQIKWEDLLVKAGLGVLPDKIPLPINEIAYLQIRDNKGSLTVNFQSIGGGKRRIYTEGMMTDLVIPALKGNKDGTPTVKCQVDIVINDKFEPVSGSVTTTMINLNLNDRLGIPLIAEELRYSHPPNGSWSLNLDGKLDLPFTLSGDKGTTNIVFKDIGITSQGLVGTVTCGSYTETHSPTEGYIGSCSLSALTLKINGAQANLGAKKFKISGDVETDLLKEAGSCYPIHFAMGVSTEGIIGTVTPVFTAQKIIDLALAKFEIKKLSGISGPPLTVGLELTKGTQNITVQLDGILTIPDLNNFRVGIDNLVIDKGGIKKCDISCSKGAPLVVNDLFGLDFKFYDVSSSKAISITSFTHSDKTCLSLVLCGGFSIMEDKEVEFSGLQITSDPSISGTFSASSAIEIIPKVLNITQFAFHGGGAVPFFCDIAGNLDLPEPLKLATATAFSFAINSKGEGKFGATVTPSGSPMDFYIAQINLNQIALNLTFGASGLVAKESKISVNAGVKFKNNGNWSSQSTAIDFPVGFDGNINLARVNIPASALSFLPEIKVSDANGGNEKSYPGIDFEIGYLGVDTLGFSVEQERLCFNINGALGLKVTNDVSGGIKFEGFTLKVPKNGNMSNIGIDYGNIRGGSLKIVDIITCNIGSVTIITSPTSLSITKPAGFTGEAPQDATAYSHLGSSTKTVDVQYYYKFADIDINIAETVSGSAKEICVYKISDTVNLCIKNVQFDLEAANFGGSFIYENNLVLFAGGFNLQTISGGAVGKFSKDSFGLFVYAGGLNIPMGPISLNKVGGGFFYKPTARDIEIVENIALPNFSDVVSKAANNIKRPSDIIAAQCGTSVPILFSAHLFAGAAIVNEGLVYVDALLTVTSNYFELLGYAKILRMADPGLKISGAAKFTIGWSPSFYAEGGLWVDVDVIKLIKGSAYFEYYVYTKPETVWAILGGADLKVLSSLDIKTEIFIGEPGFMISGIVSFPFDFYVLSGGMKFNMMVWYETIGDPTFGGYCSGEVWGSLLGGLASVNVGVEGALLCQPTPSFTADIILGAYLKVKAVYVTIFKGSIWVSLGMRGISGGTGRNSRLSNALTDAKNLRAVMESAQKNLSEALDKAKDDLVKEKELLEKALAEAKRAMIESYKIDSQTSKIIGVTLLGLDADYDLRNMYNEFEGKPEVCREIFNNILWDSRAKMLKNLRNSRDINKTAFEKQYPVIDAQSKQVFSKLQEELPKLEEIPSLEEQAQLLNPVKGKRCETITLDDKTKTIQIGFDLDQNIVQTNEQTTKQTYEDSKKFIQEVLVHVDKYKELVAKIDELFKPKGTDTPSLISLSNLYPECFENLMNYYQAYFDYLDKSYGSAVNKQKELISYRDELCLALNSESSSNCITVATKRYEFRKNLYNDAKKARDKKITETDFEKDYPPLKPEDINAEKAKWDDEVWKENSSNWGLEIWNEIPFAGYQRVIEDASFLRGQLTSELIYARKKNFIDAWAEFTKSLDEVYKCRVRLYELLYDLYDELSTTYSGYMLPIASDNKIDIAHLENGAYKEIILEPASISPDLEFGNLCKFKDYYNPKKAQIFEALQVPKITNFTGKCSGIPSPIEKKFSYANISCSFDSSYSQEVVEYGIRLEPPIFDYPIATDWLSLGNKVSNFNMLLTLWEVRENVEYKMYLRARGTAGNYIFRQARFPVIITTNQTSQLSVEDKTKPIIPIIDIGYAYEDNIGTKWISNNDRLFASWRSYDIESGIDEYQYRVLASSGLVVKDWSSAGPMGTMNIRLQDENGKPLLKNNIGYCIEAKAKNGVGLWSETNKSFVVKTDFKPPTIKVKKVGLTPYQPEKVNLWVEWEAIEEESGIGEYAYKLKGIKGNILREGTISEKTNSIVLNNLLLSGELSLEEYGRYIFEISAKDNMGHTSNLATYAVSFIDETPPPRPNNITNLALIHTWIPVNNISTSTIKFRWNSVADLESSVYGYEVAIANEKDIDITYKTLGRDKRYNDLKELENIINQSAQLGILAKSSVLPWTSVRQRLEFDTKNLFLPDGSTIYYFVKAVNGTGLSSIGVAGPFKVDTSPPEILELQSEGKYHNISMGGNQLSFKVKAQDEHTNITQYRGRITKLQRDAETVIATVFGTYSLEGKTITSPTPTLTNGIHYIYLQVANETGLWSNEFKSDGVFVDINLPIGPQINYGNITPLSRLEFRFSATDTTSGIAEYRYRIYDGKTRQYLSMPDVENIKKGWTRWYPVDRNNPVSVPYYNVKPRSVNIIVVRQDLSLMLDKLYVIELQVKDDAGNENMYVVHKLGR